MRVPYRIAGTRVWLLHPQFLLQTEKCDALLCATFQTYCPCRWSLADDTYMRRTRTKLTCAELAQNKLHIADIKIGWLELQTALYEAKQFIASEQVRRNHVEKCKDTYDARDIINLKITFSL